MGNEIKLGDLVTLAISKEAGRIIGVAEYIDGGTQYQTHFLAANGCAQTQWFTRSQLVRAE